jgi:hypothetical protein
MENTLFLNDRYARPMVMLGDHAGRLELRLIALARISANPELSVCNIHARAPWNIGLKLDSIT